MTIATGIQITPQTDTKTFATTVPPSFCYPHISLHNLKINLKSYPQV